MLIWFSPNTKSYSEINQAQVVQIKNSKKNIRPDQLQLGYHEVYKMVIINTYSCYKLYPLCVQLHKTLSKLPSQLPIFTIITLLSLSLMTFHKFFLSIIVLLLFSVNISTTNKRTLIQMSLNKSV